LTRGEKAVNEREVRRETGQSPCVNCQTSPHWKELKRHHEKEVRKYTVKPILKEHRTRQQFAGETPKVVLREKGKVTLP